MQITNTKEVRIFNSIKVLNEIISHDTISRADISVLTNLNKATVSTIVKNLIELQFVSETSIGDSTGGRKPIMLELNKELAYCISLEIQVSFIRIIITNLKNTILLTENVTVNSKSFPITFDHLCRKLEELIDIFSTTQGTLCGIGVCVNGIVDLDGLIRFIPSHNWRNLDLHTLLKERFKVPVFIDNIGNFSVLSEHHIYPKCNELIALTIDDNISAGILVNGKPLKGYLGFANSVAHHVVNIQETQSCTCGKKGCWEQYCTELAILKDINQKLDSPIKTIFEFIHLVRIQNSYALETLDKFLRYMCIGIENLIFIFNCENIVLNATLIHELPHLVSEINRNITLPITQYQEITISTQKEYSALLGASDTCIQNFYKDILFSTST